MPNCEIASLSVSLIQCNINLNSRPLESRNKEHACVPSSVSYACCTVNACGKIRLDSNAFTKSVAAALHQQIQSVLV